jgi:hypothetical protein
MSNATKTISPARFGFAICATCVIFRLGCILTLITVPRDKAIAFFNSLVHGIDVAPILRESIMPGEVLLGIVSTFALASFMGAMIAAFYNLGSVVSRKET